MRAMGGKWSHTSTDPLMQLLFLAIRPSRATYFSILTPQPIADALAETLPQALTQIGANSSTRAVGLNRDVHGLNPAQALALHLSPLDGFLDVPDAPMTKPAPL